VTYRKAHKGAVELGKRLKTDFRGNFTDFKLRLCNRARAFSNRIDAT
jgi:hypothetical protein